MSRLQGASVAALLALVCSYSHADTLMVNTTVDEDDVLGSKCSLREAVNYVNQKNIQKRTLQPIESAISTKESENVKLQNEKKSLEIQLDGAPASARPALELEIASITSRIKDNEAGIAILEKTKKTIENRITGLQVYGCVPTSTSDTDEIVFPSQTDPFILNRQIVIKDSLTLKLDDSTKSSSELTDSTTDDLKPAIIKVTGSSPSRAFLIDDGLADRTKRINVRLISLELQGCRPNAASVAVCDTNGGIILNRDDLSLTDVTMKLGGATAGGAIYNDDQATLVVIGSTFESSRASDGAAIYSTQSGIDIQQSLFFKNTGVLPTDTIIHVVDGATPLGSTQTRRSIITDSTMSTNDGIALSVPEKMRLLSLTVVANKGGVDFRNLDINLTNSIIAQDSGNPDCLNVPASPKKFRHNVYMTPACPGTDPANKNRMISGTGDEKLFAAASSDAATCDLPPADGLLCPLGNFGGSTRSHKPRLLSSYVLLSESPIVNKGLATTLSGDNDCSSVDQRGKSRNLCDIGAVELVTDNSEKQGQDSLIGKQVRFSMLEKIGDGELMPAGRCAAVVNDPRADVTQDGCPFLTIDPGKGSVTFDKVTHEAVYTPNGSYHGFDRFSYSITTTLSRFSDAVNNQGLVMNVKVVAEPEAGIDSKSFAGPVGFWGILSLAGLVQLRRRMQRG